MRRSGILVALALPALLSAGSPVAGAGPLAQMTIDEIRAFVTASFDELKVPGAAVVVVDGDGILYAEGFGTIDDADTPVTPQTPFHLASLSKQLTAIAVRQLIDSGDLGLDATVHRYVPWFGSAGSEIARITVKDLLAHTSGFSTGAGLANRSDERTDDGALERNIRRLAETPLSHAIGQFEYSNANYDALGYLVAVTSGMSFEDYLAEKVFGPLGMTHSFTSDADVQGDGLARGHYPFFGFSIEFPLAFVRGSVPSAYMASSAEDLGRVLMAHLNGGAVGGSHVLPASAMADLRKPLVHPDPYHGYGWGWWTYPLWDAGQLVDAPNISRYEVPVILEHDGSHSTYATGMVLLPDAGYGVVVLMNRNDEAASSRFYQVHTGIAQILLGRPAPALVSYDDPLGQYGRQLLGIAALLMAVGVIWALRNLRRWGRDPATAPRGLRGTLRHLLLPLVLDIGVTVAAWWLVLNRTFLGIGDYPAIIHLAPDIGPTIGVIALLGIGWGLLRTALTIRLLRTARAAA